MQTTDALLTQWEPKVHRMLKSAYVNPADYEDWCQELRIEILRASRSYVEGRGASFHTFLHICMLNRLRQLANNRRDQAPIDAYVWISTQQTTLEGGFHDEPVGDWNPGIVDDHFLFELWDQVKPTGGQSLLMDLIFSGFKFSEIKRLSIDPKRTQAVFNSLRTKMKGCRVSEV